jgi:ParB-like chromosome segregation protein Spo0J
MDEELYAQLQENINENGLNDPIFYTTTHDGEKLVIEGHTRLKACIKLKLKDIPTKEVKEKLNSLAEIKLWMIKHQFQRRNFSNIEKIQLAYLSKDVIENLAKINLSKGGKNPKVTDYIDTNAEIAKIAGVGRTTVTRYSSVLDKAPKSVIDKLNKGEISISSAYDKTKGLPDKKNKKIKVKEIIDCKFISSIEEGKSKMTAGVIEGIIILKNSSQISLLGNNLKNKFGVFIDEN